MHENMDKLLHLFSRTEDQLVMTATAEIIQQAIALSAIGLNHYLFP
jgi:hypothetical protein